MAFDILFFELQLPGYWIRKPTL